MMVLLMLMMHREYARDVQTHVHRHATASFSHDACALYRRRGVTKTGRTGGLVVNVAMAARTMAEY